MPAASLRNKKSLPLPRAIPRNSWMLLVQFVDVAGDASSTNCCLWIFRYTSSIPSKSAIASDEECFRCCAYVFARYCLRFSGDVITVNLRGWISNLSLLRYSARLQGIGFANKINDLSRRHHIFFDSLSGMTSTALLLFLDCVF